MEYLDYYDEEGNYLGYKSREEIHREGLWHNTVHCWLYDLDGNIYFQIRKDTNTFYTTASGHVQKGETIKEAFRREIMEEIGIELDSSDAILVDIVPWQMDKVKSDGSIFKDRAKANVYIDLYNGNMKDFHFDEEEVLGLVKVSAKDALGLFKREKGKIPATIITSQEGKIIIKKRKVDFKEFLVNKHETAYGKYGMILEKVLEAHMNLEYIDKISLEEYKRLLKDAGWKLLSDKQHQKALDHSSYLSCVKYNDKVIGMARLVGDNATHGLLCDVVVLSDFRHLGLGKKLVNNIKDKVYHDLEKDEQFLIELLPAYGKRNFYLNCGFQYKPENMDGMYLWIKK